MTLSIGCWNQEDHLHDVEMNPEVIHFAGDVLPVLHLDRTFPVSQKYHPARPCFLAGKVNALGLDGHNETVNG